MKKILITGGRGFLGFSIAKYLSSHKYQLFGIGRGVSSNDGVYTKWISDNITCDKLVQFNLKFDVVIHCGGSGSVANSLLEPLVDYNKTVSTTAEVLEYIRLYNPEAKFIYPSSAAVYGAHTNSPISINAEKNYLSPYGYHKHMAEDLCMLYNKVFNVDVAIVRFFSIYGPGVTKQLLWDAYNKIHHAEKHVEFWGTGDETRDWLYIDDAIRLVLCVINDKQKFLLLNGGSGEAYSIKDTLKILCQQMNVDTLIKFNHIVKAGDPQYYWSDITDALALGWKPQVKLSDGIKNYVDWVEKCQK